MVAKLEVPIIVDGYSMEMDLVTCASRIGEDTNYFHSIQGLPTGNAAIFLQV